MAGWTPSALGAFATCVGRARGRGGVLIGHSQGTFMLRDLVTREINRKPTAPNWGPHLKDASIARGDLADLVRRQARNCPRSR